MSTSYNCPNEDCEEELEAEVSLYSGSKPTWDDPGEDDWGEIDDMDKTCPKCGYDLESDTKLHSYIINKAFDDARSSYEDYKVDRYLSQREDREYWNDR